MTIRKLHSHNTNSTRESIAKDYTELYFDDATNTILLPDPAGYFNNFVSTERLG